MVALQARGLAQIPQCGHGGCDDDRTSPPGPFDVATTCRREGGRNPGIEACRFFQNAMPTAVATGVEVTTKGASISAGW